MIPTVKQICTRLEEMSDRAEQGTNPTIEEVEEAIFFTYHPAVRGDKRVLVARRILEHIKTDMAAGKIPQG